MLHLLLLSAKVHTVATLTTGTAIATGTAAANQQGRPVPVVPKAPPAPHQPMSIGMRTFMGATLGGPVVAGVVAVLASGGGDQAVGGTAAVMFPVGAVLGCALGVLGDLRAPTSISAAETPRRQNGR